MLKGLFFVLGFGVGAGATVAWLTYEPSSADTSSTASTGGELEQRWRAFMARVHAAQAEGDRAGDYTEERLHRRLDEYRKGSSAAASG